jgi:branched-chain amino acid aminotransferase
MTTPQTRHAYFEGKIVPIEQATVTIMNQTFNYGTGAFGGIRGYWNDDEQQLFMFRPADHFRRLLDSAKLLRFDLPHTPGSLTEALRQLLQAEGWKNDVYIRPLAYVTTEGIGARLHKLDHDLAMFSVPFESKLKEQGAHVTFSAWRRVDDNHIPPRGKIIGAYVNSALIKSDAILAGFDDALALNDDGHVSESSGANFFMVRNGVVSTPPVTANVLEGITRRTLIELMRVELGLEVVERQIDRTEVYLADEIFLCGTGVQLVPVTRVDHRVVGSGELGPVTRELYALFSDVVRGRAGKYRHWNIPVYG